MCFSNINRLDQAYTPMGKPDTIEVPSHIPLRIGGRQVQKIECSYYTRIEDKGGNGHLTLALYGKVAEIKKNTPILLKSLNVKKKQRCWYLWGAKKRTAQEYNDKLQAIPVRQFGKDKTVYVTKQMAEASLLLKTSTLNTISDYLSTTATTEKPEEQQGAVTKERVVAFRDAIIKRFKQDPTNSKQSEHLKLLAQHGFKALEKLYPSVKIG